MDHSRAIEQYTATSVETGTPIRLVVMLYEGALRYIHEAEQAMNARDYPRKADRINRALRIVQELSNALDESASPELTGQLTVLYEFVEHELLEASTYNDARHLSHATRILHRLLTSWQELAEKNVVAATSVDTPAPEPDAPSLDHETTRADTDRVPSLSLSA